MIYPQQGVARSFNLLDSTIGQPPFITLGKTQVVCETHLYEK